MPPLRTPDGVVSALIGLRCVLCGAEYEPKAGRYVCDVDGPAGTLDAVYDYARVASTVEKEALGSNPTMWRYRSILPIEDDAQIPSLPVGWTPLVPADSLAATLDLARLQVKDDGRQPTASYKDRASAVAVVRAAAEAAAVITTASTGNAAAALAGLCASTGQRAVIFVPRSAPEAKIAQLLAFGATVVLVDGSYTHAFDLCMKAAATFGWYNRNTGYNPYVGEGKKTGALEILEQRDWSVPDAVFVSVGDGSIIGGLHKGFLDAQRLGWVDDVPRIFGIQAAGSDYLVQAYEAGEDVATKPAITASTVADSISADLPRDRVKAMAAVRETGGAYLRVGDNEILDGIPVLAGATGIFAEPAAAAAFAGLREALSRNLVGATDDVVVVSTGSGLKDVPAAMRAVVRTGRQPVEVAGNATTDDLEAILEP